MFPSITKTTTLLLSSITLTLAFNKISVPSTVAAGQDAAIKLTTSPSFDSQFSNYRVYLATTPPGWGTGPACYLVNSSAISTTSFNVQIPAGVGPSGSNLYYISIMEFNTDPNADPSSSGFQYSSDFTFTGGTGVWSEYETSGYTVANADDLPCTAYDCARQCSQKYYPADVSDSETDLSGYKSQYECVAACPGVKIPAWDELGDGGSSSSVTGFATTQGIASATKTGSTTLSTATGTAAGQGTASSSSNASKTSSGTTSGTAASATTSSASSTATRASGSTQNVAGSLAFIFGGALAAMVAINM